MRIIPAIYPESFEEVADKLYALSGITKFVQIIICDGSYGMRRSWDPLGILPESFDYEFDLILSSWKEYIVRAHQMTAKSIVVHIDEFTDEDYEVLLRLANFYHFTLGLAISNETSVNVIIDAIHKIETNTLFSNPDKLFIQVTGVKNSDGDNRHFDTLVLDRIKVLKKMFPTYSIQVSGRITPETAGAVKNAGADRLVSSSYIFGSEDLSEAIDNLLRAVTRDSLQEKPILMPSPQLTVSLIAPLTTTIPVTDIKKQREQGIKYKASEDELIYLDQEGSL